MAKKSLHAKDAFTLIEVMVAVMIISVVIMALIEMQGNNTHIFTMLKTQTKTNQYVSFLISNDEYGFEDKNIYLYDLVNDFDIESSLRRELKEIKAKIIYQEVQMIDLREQSEDENDELSAGMVLEIGKSIVQTDDFSSSLFRVRLQ